MFRRLVTVAMGDQTSGDCGDLDDEDCSDPSSGIDGGTSNTGGDYDDDFDDLRKNNIRSRPLVDGNSPDVIGRRPPSTAQDDEYDDGRRDTSRPDGVLRPPIVGGGGRGDSLPPTGDDGTSPTGSDATDVNRTTSSFAAFSIAAGTSTAVSTKTPPSTIPLTTRRADASAVVSVSGAGSKKDVSAASGSDPPVDGGGGVVARPGSAVVESPPPPAYSGLVAHVGLIAGGAIGVVVLVVLLGCAVYKYRSRDEGTYRIDNRNCAYEVCSTRPEENGGAGSASGSVYKLKNIRGGGGAGRPRKKDVKEWYV